MPAATARVEYFWMCSHCSEFMALHFGQDGTVVNVPLPDCAQRNPEDFAIISRHKDRLLRSVTVALRREEKSD
jgi:phage terminase large subunit GpA-like protein